MSASWPTVLRACLAQAAVPGVEQVARAQALGRILAAPVQADRDYPAADLSMMDGYAIDATSRERYRVAGENRPGASGGAALAEGTARRIFTGAPLPPGATRVIPQELVRRADDDLHIVEYPSTPFVRPRGAEARHGDPVLASGTRLTPVELSIIATVGLDTVTVTKRPRVGHLVTGDEVMPHGDASAPGTRIRDSNSDLVAGLLGGIGQHVAMHRCVRDDRAEAIARVREMAAGCDVLLISGGASVGDRDHARAALEAGGFIFEAHGIEVRPGKPVGLARRGSQWAVALPGNPVSHLVALRLFVLPLLLALEGATDQEPILRRGVLAASCRSEIPRRDTFWPASVALTDGEARLTPCRFLSSGDLFGIAGADALLYLPTGRAVPTPGEPIFFLSLAPDFSNAGTA